MAIPLILELNADPGCQPPIFVRHALDLLWVEPRIDVLVDAVSVVVERFLPSVCRVRTFATQKGPTPFT